MIELFLKNIEIQNFKNLKQVNLQFNPHINCFVGKNGAGKTNLLDAIHYLSLTKSYFSFADVFSVNHNSDFFFIKGIFQKNGSSDEVLISFEKSNSKILKINGKKYKRFSDHIGKFPVVLITPYDISLVNEGSELRRKFLDTLISILDKNYLKNLISYRKLLQQRNQILKQFALKKNFDKDFLAIYDQKLVEIGTEIFQKRKNFIFQFKSYFQFYYEFISDQAEKVDIQYKSHLIDNDFGKILEEALPRDLALQYTTVGIHRDDLVFRINGYSLKKFGSNGQQKSFVIALKLAKFKVLNDFLHLKPIVMFDDIFDKLDKTRIQKILELISDKSLFGQIFITHTDFENLQQFVNTQIKKFYVQNGAVNEKI